MADDHTTAGDPGPDPLWKRRLRLRPTVHPIPVDDENYLFLIGARRQVAEGKSAYLLPQVLERIDGDRTVEEVVSGVADDTGASEAHVMEIVRHLYDWTVIDDVEGYQPGGPGQDFEPYEAQIQYFSLVSSRPYRIQERVAAGRVALTGDCELLEPLASALARSGLRNFFLEAKSAATERVAEVLLARNDRAKIVHGAATALTEADLVIHGTRSTTSPASLANNEACLKHGVPLLVFGTGTYKGFVGPMILPHESACLKCYNAGVERISDMLPNAPSLADEDREIRCELAPLPLIAAGIAAAEGVKFLSRATLLGLIEKQLLIDPGEFSFEQRDVIKVPRCDACGTLRSHSPVSAFEVGRRWP